MPWRLGPRAALLLVAGAGALVATTALLRRPEPAAEAAAPAPLTIDSALTRDEQGCAGVRSTVWHPLSGVDYTGRLRFTLPPRFGGAIALYVGDTLPLDIEATTPDGEPILTNAERFVMGPGVFVPPDYWLDDGLPLNAPPHITKLLIDASGEVTRDVRLALGRRSPRVLVRLVGYPPSERVAVCADPLGPDEIYFATGWYGEQRDAKEGIVRWMRERGAVLVTSATGRSARVRARVAPAVAAGDEVRLGVRVNEQLELAPVTLQDGYHDYEWHVPDAAWATGSNELLFTVSQTRRSGSRTLGIALASLHVQ